MRVLITGAAGFIGTMLGRHLLAQGTLINTEGNAVAITELLLLDVCAQTPPEAPDGIVIRTLHGDICDSEVRTTLFAEPVDVIFHLAATLTAEAQADPSKGTRINVRGLLDLLEQCRSQAIAPRFVFASSIATFGGDLPDVVDDNVVQQPQTSYGSHKVIAEQLLNDYSRHGIIDGRALRLPIVVVRPPSAMPSVSDQVAAIVREPLAGRDVTCPFRADTPLPVVSVQRAAQALIEIAQLPVAVFGATRAINLPALTVTPAEMTLVVAAVADPGQVPGTVHYKPDAAAQAVVDGWPRQFVSALAQRVGLVPDASFEAIVESYLSAERKEEAME